MTNVVDRYVEVAITGVSSGARKDVERDVRGMIGEMIDGRVDHGESTEIATVEVLESLGDPRQLARQYDGDHRYLIGPGQYDAYIEVLAAFATRVLPLAAIIIFAAQILSGDGSVGSLVGGAIVDSLWTTFTIGVQVAFWVTVAFVVMERTRRSDTEAEPVAKEDRWTVTDLPPEKPKRQISVADALSSLGFTVLIGAIFVLVYRNGINMYLGDEARASVDGKVPFFNPDIPAAAAWLVLGLLAADAALEIVKYAIGSWTRSIAFTQVALNVIWIVVAMEIVGAWELVNPGIRGAVPDDVADVFLGSWFEQSVLAVALVTAAISIWEAVRGYLAWRQPSDPWSV